jgi:hypothetical protein
MKRAGRNLRPHHHFIRPGRQCELRAPLLIEFQSRGDVQVSNLNLSGPRSAIPIVRAGVYGPAHDYVFSDFFLVPVAKDKHGRWKHSSWLGCLSSMRIGRRDRRRRIGCALQPWLRRLSASLQASVVRELHPTIALQLDHKPGTRRRRSGDWLNGPLNNLRRRRVTRFRVGIVIRIVIRRKIRTAGISARSARANESCSRATASWDSPSHSTGGSGSKPAACLPVCRGHKAHRSE